jgi:hypothetical protein
LFIATGKQFTRWSVQDISSIAHRAQFDWLEGDLERKSLSAEFELTNTLSKTGNCQIKSRLLQMIVPAWGDLAVADVAASFTISKLPHLR